MIVPRRPLRHRRSGFTLLEVVLVLAILAVIAAALTPFLNQFLESTTEGQSRSELQTIYRAIVGDQTTSFGFVGDVGDYPASLLDLVVSPGLPGWNGPYLNGLIVENSRVLDQFNRPYELYVVDNIAPPDRLAIISGGPDRTSTNTAANPNVAAAFAGPTPVDTNYFTEAGNADNQVFPEPSSANGVNVTIDSLFALNIQNFDVNTKVNAFVPGCPNLYSITVTSVPRGTNDVNNMLYNAGFAVFLVQGVYQLTVTARNTNAVVWTEKFTHLAGAATTRSLNLTGLDSSATSSFVLTVANFTGQQLEVFEFTNKLTPRVDPGQNKNFTVHGCAQVFVRDKNTNAVVDSFVMPFSAFTRNVTSSTVSVTIVNNTVKDKLDVFVNDLFIGQVKKGKTKTFSTGLDAGDTLKILNHKTGALVFGPVPLAAGANGPFP